MRQIFVYLFLISIVACSDRTITQNTSTIDTVAKVTDTIKHNTSPTLANAFGFDAAYEISNERQSFMVTGYFNPDDILDTAIIIRHKLTGKDALYVKHGGTLTSYLFEGGKNLEQEFDDFNWAAEFKTLIKGETVWENVVDEEIVGEDEVPADKKFKLKTDAIFVHVDEACGGGIIYFDKGKYKWLQQD